MKHLSDDEKSNEKTDFPVKYIKHSVINWKCKVKYQYPFTDCLFCVNEVKMWLNPMNGWMNEWNNSKN